MGNSGAAYRLLSGRGIAGVEGRTDAQGWFALSPPATGTYNVEAVLSDSSKAWRSAVQWAGQGDQANAGSLRLGPTGAISGRVKSSVSSVTDFSNTFVFIPGSSYVAVTRADGTYTLANVPAAAFELGAYNLDLGDARLPNEDNPGLVRVDPNQTTAAPALVLKILPPKLTNVSRSGVQEPTDNGAEGSFIDLHGEAFGFNRGSKFEVRFAAATAEVRERLGEGLIRVKVPPAALNGQILVLVGGTLSNALDFRVMKQFDLGTLSALNLKVGETYDLGAAVTAYDTSAVRILEFKDGATILKHRPNVTWAADAAGRVGVTQRGMVTALSPGSATVTATAGDLPPRTVIIAVTDPSGATPTPAPTATPTPAPTATPTPSPTPAPTATPTPAPTATPAPTPSPSPSYTAYAVEVQISAAAAGPIFLPGQGAGSNIYPTSVKLTASVLMGDNSRVSQASWTSGDSQVATVDSTGLVKAGTKTGTARITATSLDGQASTTHDVTVVVGGSADVVVD